MATTEFIEREERLKAKLIGRIGRTHDASLLREVESLLDEKLPEGVYVLSADEREKMNIARHQLDEGKGIPGEIVEEELNDWLAELEQEI